MQDTNAPLGGGGGGGGSWFTAGVGGEGSTCGDHRRVMRAAYNQQQPIKCPRCDSLNTKFCYYNNYNLSQPRHFCKSCRRYWTKGGVLRKVPVGGGGCKKSKRSKPKPSSSSSSSSVPPREQKSSHSHTSSETSSLTATTMTATTAGALPEVVSATNCTLVKFAESSSRLLISENCGLVDDGEILGDDIGSLREMMLHDNNINNNNNIVEDQKSGNDDDDAALKTKMNRSDEYYYYLDETTVDDQQQQIMNGNGNGNGNVDGGMFDFNGSLLLDQAYWSQTQWPNLNNNNNNNSINYFLP